MPIIIHIPGSKSITNRILTLSALSGQKIALHNAALCDDSAIMVKALNKLGFKAKFRADTILLQKSRKKLQDKIKINTGNAGTSTRFLTALCTTLGKELHIDGDKRMRQRPIAALTQALKKLGAEIDDNEGYPPITIGKEKIRGGTISILGDISSQYISALLMTLPFAENNSIIKIENELCSKPYIDITLKNLREFGLKIINKNYEEIRIKGAQKAKKILNYKIESDASSASYIAAFSTLNPEKKIILANINKNYLQGDIAFLKYLEKMGCKIKTSPQGTQIIAPKELKSLGKIDMNSNPDLVMTFAILAMFTNGKTRITNIANLRIKESDRITALENEIRKLDIKVQSGLDYLKINGDPTFPSKLPVNKKITIKTYNDHRIAMCFGILKNLIPQIKIENPGCVSKSYPTFWQDLQKLHNIALIGLRGSGKSELGKILAKKLKRKFIDLDLYIEKKEGEKIKNIVFKKGWSSFRKLEKKAIKELAKMENLLIATGGGTIVEPENRQILQKTSTIIYLERNPKECLKWIGADKNRPPLTNSKKPLQELQKVYRERKDIYEQSANFKIKRQDDLNKDSEKIIKLLNFQN